MHRLNRHQDERRDQLLLDVIDALEHLQGEIDHLTARPPLGPVLNGDSGELVVSRYRPVISHAMHNRGLHLDAAIVEVQSDVGDLLFPAFDRFMLPTIRTTGCWEPDEAAFIRQHLSLGMTALNIGANVGYTALVLAAAVGKEGLVVALEPEPLNFALLWRNLVLNDATQVLPVHAAAGESTTTITLQRSPDNAGDHRTAPQPVSVGAVEVPLVAIDDLLEPDARVDLVSVDAQGYDHRIVRGMRELIERCHPTLLLEFWPPGIMELGDDPHDIVEEYQRLGYQRMTVLTTGVNATEMTAADLVAHAMEGRDHVTLVLTAHG